MTKPWNVLMLGLICAVFFPGACTPGVVTDGDIPDDPSDTTTHTDTTVVQRGTLTVRVGIDAADAALAATAGVVTTGLTVRLKRIASTEPEQSAVTDAAGSVRFERLLAGSYQISVDRPLTATELARLPAADREASIFSGGASLTIAPPARETDISLVAARRGSLIVSEIFVYSRPAAGQYAHYMEIYNNGDTTAYLDGMLSFRTSLGLHNARTGAQPCSVNAALRLDETGVWASVIERFPGTGRDYAVPPGNARVWAMDAVDHRSAGEGLQDLRAANFESIFGDDDPNNPGATDMLRFTNSIFPHGPKFTADILVGLALPIATDTTQLERKLLLSYVDGAPFPVFKIPRDAIVDVAGFRKTPEVEAGPSGYADQVVCEPFTAAVFERSEARLVDSRIPMGISRRVLGKTPAGRDILQRTRTGSRDFELASPLMRSLLRPPQ